MQRVCIALVVLMPLADLVRPSLINYRGLLLWQCANFLVPPLALARLVVSVLRSRIELHPLAKAALYIAAVPLIAALRIALADYRDAREAHRRGAALVPRVKGRLPGNIDVMARLVREFESGYVLQAYQDLLDEYGVKTLNMRLLWSDVVSASVVGRARCKLMWPFRSSRPTRDT